MAFNNSITARYDELRSPNPPSSSNSSASKAPSSRYSGSFLPNHSQPFGSDTRTSLQRRQTTDLSKMPAITPIGQPPAQIAESVDMSASTIHKAQLVEKKRLELKSLQEQKERFEAQIAFYSHQEEVQTEALDRLTQDFQQSSLNAGHQSEPTTPPEYREAPFGTGFGRNNRYSTSSITSPPGLNRSSRSGSTITSPPSELAQTLHNHINNDTLPSKSVPGSRRGSSEAIRAYVPETNGSSRRNGVGSNRYSMPVTGSKTRLHETVPEHSTTIGLDQINTTSFLFDEDDAKESTTSPDVKSYLQRNATDNNFPILVRENGHPGVLSASSRALDLALSQSPGPEPQANGWDAVPRHRLSQQNFPHGVLTSSANGQLSNGVSSADVQTSIEAVSNLRNPNRHSMEASLAAYTAQSSQATSSESTRPTTLGSIHSSYSTNDVPTLKKANGTMAATVTPPKTQAQQQFHNHNASLGRIPANVMSSQHSRELSGGDARIEEQPSGYHGMISGLQASAAPFSTAVTAASLDSTASPMAQYASPVQFSNQAYFQGYGMQMMNVGMTPMQMASPLAFQNQIQTFQPHSGYSTYPNFTNQSRIQDNQARVMQQRRVLNGDDNARFTNVKLEQLQGEILGLCKDQHGCRYLQKKLEERNAGHIHIIFVETYQHVVELMTDPFGNYLCQKLLEFCNDDQRTILINNAAPEMVKIALNSHGTRALQKMIEFITTQEQIQTVIHALNDKVVELIQDLNGNHVIQKCLNRLSATDAHFIFETVGASCVAVGTHRHGCCVLQRCIDHATGPQKIKLIGQITASAFHLVQDPFGNYVLQYIVDLQEDKFTNPLCYAFQGQIPSLSKQKFSSNVVEKCLRGAEPPVRSMMIEEMLNTNELERMLKDSYANYVVQTAMDYADPETKGRLVEAIRPLLPLVRQTPHGRRIQSKIMQQDGQGRFSGSGTPTDRSSGQIPLGMQMTTSPMSNSYAAPVNAYSGMNSNFSPQFRGAYAQYSAPAAQSHYMQFSPDANQSTSSYARIPQLNAGGFF